MDTSTLGVRERHLHCPGVGPANGAMPHAHLDGEERERGPTGVVGEVGWLIQMYRILSSGVWSRNVELMECGRSWYGGKNLDD